MTVGCEPSTHGRPKLLIVEDDTTIAANLHQFLELRGFVVDLAHDGPAAVARISAESYDLIVLDLGLPRADGLQVLDTLRRHLIRATPVLVLTARSELDSRLEAFELGADDYLTKPFALAEVEARLLALHRRSTGAVVPTESRAGPLRIDRRSRQVRVGDTLVRLMPRSMLMLERLARDPGAVVSRRELEDLLWPDGDVPADAMRGQVYLLRRALSEAGFDGIETVHGVGFRLRI